MRLRGLHGCAAALLTAPGAAHGPEIGTSPEIGYDNREIIVTGRPARELLSAKGWSNVHVAYKRHAARVAPRATVTLIARGMAVAGRYAFALGPKDETERRFPLNADGGFTLEPSSPGKGERLYLSSGVAPRGLRFLVATPGMSPERRRIGDIRLECQLWWAAVKHRTSFVVRAAAGSGGPCGSRRFGYSIQTGRPIVDAKVTLANGSTRDVPVSKTRRSAWPPIADASIPNDAVLILR